MSDFTKSKWSLDEDNEGLVRENTTGNPIALVIRYQPFLGKPDAEQQANARLIANAPVMYELLNVLRGVFVNLEHANPTLSIFREVIEKTLAQIDGEETKNED